METLQGEGCVKVATSLDGQDDRSSSRSHPEVPAQQPDFSQSAPVIRLRITCLLFTINQLPSSGSVLHAYCSQ